MKLKLCHNVAFIYSLTTITALYILPQPTLNYCNRPINLQIVPEVPPYHLVYYQQTFGVEFFSETTYLWPI